MITSKIEENASLLINILIDKDRMILFDLLLRSRLRESDFYITIGWLLREGKVFFLDDKKAQLEVLVLNDIKQNWVYLNPSTSLKRYGS
ncbi:MAG: winged helix-turn-helix domain-containing protein [Bacteroidales bacterium]